MKKSLLAGVLGLAGLAVAGWFWMREPAPAAPERQAGAAAPAAGGASRPGGGAPVSVSTVKAVQRDQRVTLEATGTVSSLNTVDIKPQVSSMVDKVHVKEGQFVKRGELLFTLDNRADAVNVTKARAQLARDEAALDDAQTPARAQPRPARPAIRLAERGRRGADAGRDAAGGRRRRARPRVEAAQLGLGYHRITAPSAGRVGAINVFARQLGPAERPGAADDHPARSDRGQLQPAAAQPRRRAAGPA